MSKILLPLTIRQAEYLNEVLCSYLIQKAMCESFSTEDELDDAVEEMEELEATQKMLAYIIHGIDFVKNRTSEIYEEEI